jgi:hypothetical protein
VILFENPLRGALPRTLSPPRMMNRSAEAMTVAVVRKSTPGTRGSVVYYVLRSAWRAVTVSPDSSALLARSTDYSQSARRAGAAPTRTRPAGEPRDGGGLRLRARGVQTSDVACVRARPFPKGLHRGQSATGSPSVFVGMKC